MKNWCTFYWTILQISCMQFYTVITLGNQVTTKICKIWLELKIVRGKARYSQNHESLKRVKQDIEKILATWL